MVPPHFTVFTWLAKLQTALCYGSLMISFQPANRAINGTEILHFPTACSFFVLFLRIHEISSCPECSVFPAMFGICVSGKDNWHTFALACSTRIAVGILTGMQMRFMQVSDSLIYGFVMYTGIHHQRNMEALCLLPAAAGIRCFYDPTGTKKAEP